MSKSAAPGNSDISTLRELAMRYKEAAQHPKQDRRRQLWRRHNCLEDTPFPILVRSNLANREIVYPLIECSDTFYRTYEILLRQYLFQDSLDDDTILEPWIVVPAVHKIPPEGPWGVKTSDLLDPDVVGARKADPPLKDFDNISKLIAPNHCIDEEETRRHVLRLKEAIGDILEVVVSRAPLYRNWHGDISTDLALLRGHEQILWDMTDNPDWLKTLVSFIQQGILNTHHQAEQAGDWNLMDHENQAVPYALELPDPQVRAKNITRGDLWIHVSSQEFTGVSPAMFEEFLLRYQMPIMAEFGLVAYGCCENLTQKISALRCIPNLRRIAVTPSADLSECARQIQRDYVYSLRPNPAEMVCCGFDPEHIDAVITSSLEKSKGCCVDITLKDVKTVENQPQRLKEWVGIVRKATDRFSGS